MRGKNAASAAARKARAESEMVAELEAENRRLRRELAEATRPDRSEAELRMAELLSDARDSQGDAERRERVALQELAKVTKQRDIVAGSLAALSQEQGFKATMEAFAVLGELGLADHLSRSIRRAAKGSNLGFSQMASGTKGA